MRLRQRVLFVVCALLAVFGLIRPQTIAAWTPANAPVQFQAGAGSSCRVAIRGQKQGQFPGTQVNRQDKWIPCTQFLMTVSSARDAATGMPAGRKQYSPIAITKEWDAASPQILSAASSNEALPLVEFEFIKTNPRGEQYVFESIKLTNATISSVKRYIGFPDNGEPPNPHSLEDVSFTFQKIDITNNDGKTSFTDDWSAAR